MEGDMEEKERESRAPAKLDATRPKATPAPTTTLPPRAERRSFVWGKRKKPLKFSAAWGAKCAPTFDIWLELHPEI